MPLIPPAPQLLQETRLYAELRGKSEPSDGLIGKVDTLIEAATPLLNRISAGPFENYTLHDPGHSRKILHLAEQLIPEQTITQLSALELAVIIMAAYLHDLGMYLSSIERKRIVDSKDYEKEVRSRRELAARLSEVREKHRLASEGEHPGLELLLFQLQQAALASYLRPRHASPSRYKSIFRELQKSAKRYDLFCIGGSSFEQELIDICSSHTRDVRLLLEPKDAYTDRFPRDLPVAGMRLNTQFCAAVLRVADILDFDRERTPAILFESLDMEDSTVPGAAVSLEEWNKHLAVQTLELNSNELVVVADSNHPVIEYSIREFCKLIERELRDTASVLRRNPVEITDVYQLDLPVSVRAHIRAQGYVYRELAFRLNETAIAKLLMGDSLYKNRAVAFRELIQNAVDACAARRLLEGEHFQPKVEMKITFENSEQVWLNVKDNGIGMDDAILSEYLFNIGSTYYASAEFQQLLGEKFREFTPVSRFGIGLLSIFMIGDRLEISTRRFKSVRGDDTLRVVSADNSSGLAVVQERPGGSFGTTVRVRLKERRGAITAGFLSNAFNYIKRTVVRPSVPVSIRFGSEELSVLPGNYVELKDAASTELKDLRIEPIVLDVGRWSDRISGRVVLFFFEDLEGQLHHQPPAPMVPLTHKDYTRFLSRFAGNRVTVNGMQMRANRLSRVLGEKEYRLPGIFDVEIRGDDDIEYDVARDKLVGIGLALVRAELRYAIVRGIRESGVLSRFSDSTKVAFNKRTPKWYEPPVVEDPDVLEAVREALPRRPWPPGLHILMSRELSLPSHIVHSAISTLLKNKRLPE